MLDASAVRLSDCPAVPLSGTLDLIGQMRLREWLNKDARLTGCESPRRHGEMLPFPRRLTACTK